MLVAKDIMPKKLFGWKKSLKRSHNNVTDAVMLEDNRNVGDSSEVAQSRSLSMLPISQHSDNQLIRPNDSLVDPHNAALSISHSQRNIYISYSKGVHFGNNVVQFPNKRSNSEDDIEKTKSIAKMMESNHPINKNIMEIISTHLGENWRSLFRFLNFSDGQIDQMKEDYYISGVKEVIYRLLLDYSRNDDDASLGHITKLMWKLGFKKCVKILKDHYKRGDLINIEIPGRSREGCCSKGKNVD